jgi:hypothetical protein
MPIRLSTRVSQLRRKSKDLDNFPEVIDFSSYQRSVHEGPPSDSINLQEKRVSNSFVVLGHQ